LSLQSPPPPLGSDWKNWGERLNAFLVSTRDRLRHLTEGESAAEDGVLMWCRCDDRVKVSINGAYMPLSYGYNSYGVISDTTDQTLSSANTATAITWNTNGNSKNISIDPITSRIVFAKAGRYHISFTAQITSGSSSAKTVWFFPRINGVDVAGSTMKVTCTGNNETQIQSRAGIFDVEADDYMESMWACDSTNITLESAPATAFAPATPSVTLMITEINA
jgi:hypothetical protein